MEVRKGGSEHLRANENSLGEPKLVLVDRGQDSLFRVVHSLIKTPRSRLHQENRILCLENRIVLKDSLHLKERA